MQYAREFAIREHGNQMYGEHPYATHLHGVVQVITSHGYLSDIYRISGFLHDILEDTEIEPSEIERLFGIRILTIVQALTKLPYTGEPDYQSLRNDPVALVVKLCDTISNLNFSISEGNPKGKKYLKRYPTYRQELYTPGEFEPLWQTLKQRLDAYQLLVVQTNQSGEKNFDNLFAPEAIPGTTTSPSLEGAFFNRLSPL